MPDRKKGAAAKTASSAKASGRKTEKEKIRSKERETQEVLEKKKRLHDEIWAIVLIALGTFFAVSLQTQATGQIGGFVQSLLFGGFGRIAYALSYYLILYGVLVFVRRASYITTRSILFLVLLFLFISAINASLYPITYEPLSLALLKEVYVAGSDSGGVLGVLPASILIKYFGREGMYILSVAGIFIALLFIVDTPVATFFDQWRIRRLASRQVKEDQLAINRSIIEKSDRTAEQRRVEAEIERAKRVKEAAERAKQTETEETTVSQIPLESPRHPELMKADEPPAAVFVPIPPATLQVEDEVSARKKKILEYVTDDTLFGSSSDKPAKGYGLDGRSSAPSPEPDLAPDIPATDASVEQTYHFPPVELLKKPERIKSSDEDSSMQSKATLLEETLHSFGVSASVSDVVKGPTVTRFEIQPSAGVKVASIVRLADDIALNLKAKSIRIEAPIPGKAAIGIEVENEVIRRVVLRELIDSDEFRSHSSRIAVAVGKSIAGDSVVTDLKDMPHLLIAGATGSGKSVFINTLIISLLYRARPEEVKLLLIDPKVVELGNYNGIPHLLVPVVTEPAKAASSLLWAVSEMTSRYKKFAEEGVRDLEYYNESMRSKGEEEHVLPQIVIVIDELADLMMVAPSQVEESICRLAQMARAAGMHLIVATQRPSVDVITGVIKANIPSRIAFAVASQFDSRTILDMGGAEKLVGKGDMLFSPQGLGKPIRVQGCFVSNSEIRSVISFMEKNAEKQDYDKEVIAAIERVGPGSVRDEDDDDELLADAIDLVVQGEHASVSMLQRRFRIGYNRAARLVDMMEERGIVGPADGSRPRKVLMSADQYLQYDSMAQDRD
jgi:S-DNA-T family DNA segregation ATPase FtsK/SpoIIIE